MLYCYWRYHGHCRFYRAQLILLIFYPLCYAAVLKILAYYVQNYVGIIGKSLVISMYSTKQFDWWLGAMHQQPLRLDFAMSQVVSNVQREYNFAQY